MIRWTFAFFATFLLALVLIVAFGNKACRAETMVASYYGAESGHRTASGARFEPEGRTAAHRSLPFGTKLPVCYRGCVVVTVNDRGPFVRGRQLDLSKGAAREIGLIARGHGPVQVERVN